MHMYSICLPPCWVGVQTFPSTIKALCASQSQPCMYVSRGRARRYFPFITHPLASCVCEWHPYEITRIHTCLGAFLDFVRMSTVLKYEQMSREEVRLEGFFLLLNIAKWCHLCRLHISTQTQLAGSWWNWEAHMHKILWDLGVCACEWVLLVYMPNYLVCCIYTGTEYIRRTQHRYRSSNYLLSHDQNYYLIYI